MKNKVVSSLSALTPDQVWDVKTGELVTDWQKPVDELLRYVQSESEHIYEHSRERVEEVCALPQKWKPAEHARLNGIKLVNLPPANVKAVSRLEKLVQEKLISEVSSYVTSRNPLKKPPTFYKRVNLGSVDKQMSSLSLDGVSLTLLWKVWDRELLFEFTVPGYVLLRNIAKWSLPIVQASRKTGEPVFIFSYQETPLTRAKQTKPHSAGVDLGRAQPFTLAIITEDNRRVAHYTGSKRLVQLSAKRTRLLTERAQTLAKAKQYAALKHNPLKQEVLENNALLLSHKIKRLGSQIAWVSAHEITQKLQAHKTNQLKLENLAWVTGVKYGSRWNHSAMTHSITHSLSRVGITTVKVNPRNTSQDCHKCGQTITHQTKKRSVHCINCKQSFDRDYNAAMNIAAKTLTYPAVKRPRGDSPTLSSETVKNDSPENHFIGAALRKTT